ncbi:MAG TPA: hypothetical protein VIG04_00710 [Gemmatimonadales bacterium]|jgi:hypothetical protein
MFAFSPRSILRCFAFPAAAVAVVLSARPPRLAAQDTLQRIRPALGTSVDRFIYEGAGITAVSFHYSVLKANTLSTEVAAAFFPDALQAGALLLAPDVGAAYDARGGGFDLLLKAGLSTLMAMGGGVAFQPGYHFGSGLLIRTGKASGIRLDVVRHAYLIDQETEGIWSVGIGVTSLPSHQDLGAEYDSDR